MTMDKTSLSWTRTPLCYCAVERLAHVTTRTFESISQSLKISICVSCLLQEVSSPQQTTLGKVQVCVNPSPHNPDLPDPISVGPENFQNNNGHSVKSDVLVIRVSCPVRRSLPNGLCNGDTLDSGELTTSSTNYSVSASPRHMKFKDQTK